MSDYAPVTFEVTLTDDGPLWSAEVTPTPDGPTVGGQGPTVTDACDALGAALVSFDGVTIRVVESGA